MSAPRDVLAVECPYCGSSPQERCSTNPNRIRDWRWCKPHAARVRAAQAYDESAFVQKAELLMGISQRIASVARG